MVGREKEEKGRRACEGSRDRPGAIVNEKKNVGGKNGTAQLMIRWDCSVLLTGRTSFDSPVPWVRVNE